MAVDEYGFVLIAGMTTSVKWGMTADTSIYPVLYAKTHWEFTWEMEDYYCDRRCMDPAETAGPGEPLTVASGVGDCTTKNCEHYGTRFTRPMQYTNSHGPTFMTAMAWAQDKASAYVDLRVWDVNEHMDDQLMI